ncbi:phosphate ABC transporter permease subunit PstC [Natrarchaeobaculum sulfurireducens]|uniref:Phosphate transport system permease protein n=1 Tax=Natrarchaeobaculum sulfurireducens TaxID=2044521 RepID=A0A346PAP6_9EURY|nr:phosphate ABC transporter permease subunit PstC [Natrarchaeobaculum sulfurireducens]AXR76591.1 ABC-type phosphate transport system, permease component [Natrarchaeobaculum sulfurireducens]
MSTETQSGPEISGDDSLEAAHEKNRRVRRALFGCAAITVVTTLAIFLVLFDNAASYFFGARISEVLFDGDSFARTITFTEFFTGTRWAPDHSTPAHGVLPIVWGTLAITIGAAFVSIPIGTATALYLSEYASTATRNRLKPVLEVLAGIPTIVYGYFAVSFLTPVIVGGIASNVVNPAGAWLDSIAFLAPGLLEPAADAMMSVSVGRYSLLAGVLVVGTMTIPMVSSISEDAMQAVPDDLRNGAYALGATKYQVSLRIVLPAAVSGIFASYILAVSRAIGETMAVTLAAGFNANLTANPFAEIMTMTAYLVSMARGTSAVGTVEYQSLFAVGLLLFLMTLSMNLLNDWMKRRFQEEYR